MPAENDVTADRKAVHGRSALRVLSVVGARPQFVKLAPVSRELARRMREMECQVDDLIVHTGQHYDGTMSKIFFDELGIPTPVLNLGVGSGSHGDQTARMLAGLEESLVRLEPHVVVVYGDTNSTLSGALAAAKLHIPLVHVEAGLRSFNRRMPEEINRIVTDHLSDRLLAPTASAMSNLQREGLAERAFLTGDVMYDAVLHSGELARIRSSILELLSLRPGEYGVVTVHRAENTESGILMRLMEALERAAKRWGPLAFPLHPRTASVIRAVLPGWSPGPQLRIIEPLGYLDMLALTASSKWVLTDSGGLQKEAMFLGRPCVTLRNETEWTETVDAGANLLAGPDGARLDECLERWSALRGLGQYPAQAVESIFGDGRAAAKIVTAVLEEARHGSCGE